MDSDTRRVNKLLIKKNLKEESNPQFHPSLRDFEDNSNIMGIPKSLGLEWMEIYERR